MMWVGVCACARGSVVEVPLVAGILNGCTVVVLDFLWVFRSLSVLMYDWTVFW